MPGELKYVNGRFFLELNFTVLHFQLNRRISAQDRFNT